MNIRLILITSTALALFACGEKKTETTTTTATETTGTAVSDAGTATATAAADAANDIGQSKPVNDVQDAVGSMVGKASAVVTDSTEGYVTGAAIGDMYEREAAELALQRSKSAAVKKFAAMMITDHKQTSAELKKLIAADKIAATTPTVLDSRRQGNIDNLKAAAPADFDTVYIDQQTAAHEEALTLHKSYADDGANAALKGFAAKTVLAVRNHLATIKKIDAKG